MREHAQGRLRLERIDTPDAVPKFVEAIAALGLIPGRRWANSVPNRSRETEVLWLSGLARRGFLCSYILTCREEPVAGLIGYQFEETCVVEYTLYSKSFSPFSPGTVLMHLAYEDLISRGVRLIDFGFGFLADSDPSTHVVREGASIILWRKSLANRFLTTSYKAFRALARSLRHLAAKLGLWHRNPPRRSS